MKEPVIEFEIDVSVFGFGLRIHNKEQLDLMPDLSWISPILCINLNKPNKCTRVFCFWRKGIQLKNKIYRW